VDVLWDFRIFKVERLEDKKDVVMPPAQSGNSTCKSVLDELQTLYLGGVEVEKEGVAVFEF